MINEVTFGSQITESVQSIKEFNNQAVKFLNTCETIKKIYCQNIILGDETILSINISILCQLTHLILSSDSNNISAKSIKHLTNACCNLLEFTFVNHNGYLHTMKTELAGLLSANFKLNCLTISGEFIGDDAFKAILKCHNLMNISLTMITHSNTFEFSLLVNVIILCKELKQFHVSTRFSNDFLIFKKTTRKETLLSHDCDIKLYSTNELNVTQQHLIVVGKWGFHNVNLDLLRLFEIVDGFTHIIFKKITNLCDYVIHQIAAHNPTLCVFKLLTCGELYSKIAIRQVMCVSNLKLVVLRGCCETVCDRTVSIVLQINGSPRILNLLCQPDSDWNTSLQMVKQFRYLDEEEFIYLTKRCDLHGHGANMESINKIYL
jgi:hypothetical protein